ncbi:hypothetical protein VCR3J2_520191 [Vibrio coralliirubri]|nr:hypothetical protein VCR4J2_560049 [Vibrio coralliirubri]CDT92733.1 hypothetical protein VCR29J2_960190 [Vibrio coralliirubri]CDU00695.1 hypothetical protein VCR3J2_520191 [Vibrio coralliirubri]
MSHTSAMADRNTQDKPN